jgi:hypothetical protein
MMTDEEIISDENISTPSGGFGDAGQRGLLDIQVMLSTPTPTAGSEFKVYVLVTNPFDVPIWPQAPKVFLPSELVPITRGKPAQEAIKSLNVFLNELAEGGASPPGDKNLGNALQFLAKQTSALNLELEQIESRRGQISAELDSAMQGKSHKERLELYNTEEIKRLSLEDASLVKKADQIKDKISSVRNQLQMLTESRIIISESDLQMANLDLAKPIYIQAKGKINIESAPQFQPTPLESSSLVPGLDALQPGNTAVFSLVLSTKKNLFFRPIQYELQYSINYAFKKGGDPHTNNASQSLTIRAPISYVFSGASLGGLVGFFARFLQTSTSASSLEMMFQGWLPALVTLILTVILSGMAVVFLARKSDVQTMVSVEDFWGGLVIGFLIGYTGTAAFESLTGISSSGYIPPGIDTP